MSKGSTQRPAFVPDQDVDAAWRRIFNKPPATPDPPPKEQDDGERIPGAQGDE